LRRKGKLWREEKRLLSSRIRAGEKLRIGEEKPTPAGNQKVLRGRAVERKGPHPSVTARGYQSMLRGGARLPTVIKKNSNRHEENSPHQLFRTKGHQRKENQKSPRCQHPLLVSKWSPWRKRGTTEEMIKKRGEFVGNERRQQFPT